MIKRTLSVALIICMLLGVFTVYADETPAMQENVFTDEFDNGYSGGIFFAYECENMTEVVSSSVQFGDVSKAHRTVAGKIGWLTYRLPRISGFSAKTITDVNNDVHLEFYTSPDNAAWTKIDVNITDLGKQPWQGIEYSASGFDAETQFLKIVVPDVKGAECFNKQLLSVTLKGKGDPVLREDYVPETFEAKLMEPKTAKIFETNFEKKGNEVITSALKSSVGNVTRYGKSCLEIRNLQSGAKTRVDFYNLFIKSDVIKIEAVLMPVDKNAVREIFITSENGEKISLLVLNSDGEAGRYENGNFVGFNMVSYNVNEWINAEIAFSSAEKSLLVKLNGNEIFSGQTENTLSGSISKISFEDTAKYESSVTYYDFLRISESKVLNLSGDTYITVNKPILKDINLHPNKENIMFLVEKGIITGGGGFYFRPEENITCDAFLKMVMLAGGIYVNEKAEYWAQPYIDAATKIGVNFDGINFAAPITRAQAALLISRIITEEKSGYYDTVKTNLKDISGLSDEIRDCIVDTVSKGIMNADKSGNFYPESNITRSDAATLIAGILDNSKRVSPVYKIGIFAEGNSKAVKNLENVLGKNGYEYEFLTEDDMQDSKSLTSANYSCVILFNHIVDTEEARVCLRSYLANEGDLVTCGENLFEKFNNNIWQLPIYEGYDYDPYRLTNVASVVTSKEQEVLSNDINVKGSFGGTSAVGFLFADSSAYIPVLEARNVHEQEVGHAAGILVNYDGIYKDSNWLIYGIGNEEFYESEGFGDSLVSVVNKFNSTYFSDNYNREKIRERNRIALENFEITEPKPEGSVTVDRETGTLIGLDGKPLFLFGANTYGLAEYHMGMGNDLTDDFDINKLERVFKMASDIGVNCFRFWDPPTTGKRVDVMKQMARKYGVYLYFLCHGPHNHEGMYEMMRDFAKAYGDEPMVIGYDLMNEPQGLFALLVRVPAERNPIAQSDILEKCSDTVKNYQQSIDWLVDNSFLPYHEFFTREELSRIAAVEMFWRKELLDGDQAKMTVADTVIKTQLDDNQQYVLSLINSTIENYFKIAEEVIHEYDPDAMLTVGYFNAATLVPANKNMGLQNLHAYTFANEKKDVQEALDAMDKMKQNLPEVPVVFGEFCYSGGQLLKAGPHQGKLGDYDVAALGEVAHWLYSYAMGYSGAMIWCLQEWNPTNYRWGNDQYAYADGATWDPGNGLRRERQGLYYYAGGNDMYKAKSQGIAMKFFMENFAAYHNPGEGKLVLTDADNQAKVGFLFTDDTAEYVANTAYNTERLKFSSEKSPMVMVDWSDGKLNILATRETVVKIKPSAYIKDFKASDIKVNGFCGPYEVDGEYITITLLKGEAVAFEKK